MQLLLLKTLTLWALGYSDAVKALINSSYNQKRTADDLNQPLSVQPWGHDSEKRRYYLVEGDDNTSFRIYREGNPAALYNRQWISVAGSIDEAKALAEKLGKDNGQNARKLSRSILNNIANFEEKEEVCAFPPNGPPLTTRGQPFRSRTISHRIHALEGDELTCLPIETQATRVQTHAEGTLPPTRAGVLSLRGPNQRKASQVYILG